MAYSLTVQTGCNEPQAPRLFTEFITVHSLSSAMAVNSFTISCLQPTRSQMYQDRDEAEPVMLLLTWHRELKMSGLVLLLYR